MHLKKLRLNGFQSYAQPVDLDLDELNLVAIIGTNGAGKSTIINAVEWALYGKNRDRQVTSVINRSAQSASVELTIGLNDQTYRIRRTRSTRRYEVDVRIADETSQDGWRVLTDKNPKSADPYIVDLLGMDHETARQTWLINQDSVGGLCTMLPAERRTSLMNDFGLTKYATYAERAEAKLKKLTGPLDEARNNHERITAQHDLLTTSLTDSEHADLTDATITEKLEDLANKDAQVSHDLSKERGDIDTLLTRQRQAQTTLDEFTTTHRTTVQAYQDRLAQAQNTATNAEKQHARTRTALNEATTNLETTQTTGTEETQRAHHNRDTLIRRATTDGKTRQEQAETTATKTLAAAEEHRRHSLDQVRSHTQEQLAQAQSALTDLRTAKADAEAAAWDVSDAAEKLAQAEQDRDRIAASLPQLRQTVTDYASAVSANQMRMDSAWSGIQELDERIAMQDRPVHQHLSETTPGTRECFACGSSLTEKQVHDVLTKLNKQRQTLADTGRNAQTQRDQAATNQEQAQQKVTTTEHALTKAEQAVTAAREEHQNIKRIADSVPELDERITTAENNITTLETNGQTALAEATAHHDRLVESARAEGQAGIEQARQKARELVDEATASADQAIVEAQERAERAQVQARERVTAAEAEVERSAGESKEATAAVDVIRAEGEPVMDQARYEELVQAVDAAKAAVVQAQNFTENKEALRVRRDQLRAEQRLLWDEQSLRSRVGRQLDDLAGPEQEARQKVQALEKDHRTWKALFQAYQPAGIPAMMLAEVVEELNDEANDILADLEAPFGVNISTQRDTAKGGTKDEVMVYVTVPEGEVSYDSLSGAEKLRCALAVRLARIHCIARRTGTPVETLFMDEGWGALDEENKHLVLQLFIALSKRYAMYTISHLDDIKSSFPNVLEVCKDTGASTVAVR